MKNSKRKFLILIPLFFLSISGCENPVSADLDQEFRLKYGRQAYIEEEHLKIFFLSVPEDSRCPLNVNCFWEGNAKVVLELRKGLDRKVDTLNTHPDNPGGHYPNSISFLEYEITLKDLQPYPVHPEEINPKDYTATLVITKNGYPDYLQNLFKHWRHSFEEETEYTTQIYRPSDYKDFSPARFRKSYIFKEDGTCSWLVIAPTDGQYYVNGYWEYSEENNILKIEDDSFNQVERLQIITLQPDLLSLLYFKF